MMDISQLEIIAQASALAGYAATCKTSNTEEWMERLAFRINTLNEAMHDTDIVKFNGTSFDVTRKEYQE